MNGIRVTGSMSVASISALAPAALVLAACAGSVSPTAPPAPTVSVSSATVQEDRKPPPALADDSTRPNPPQRPLVLHKIATTETPAHLSYSGTTTRILVPSCIAEVRDGVVTPGSYPLPGRACREPLKQLASSGGRQWLQAGPELWVRTDKAGWRLDSTIPNADHVLLPAGGATVGLAVVVPFRQAARSDYQVSSSFELHRVGGASSGKVPLAAAAKGNPNLSFDDFMSECFTKTRVAIPRAFNVSSDGNLQVFGTECDRNDQSVRSVVETWKLGSTSSTVTPLPFTRAEQLLQVAIVNDHEMWALQSSQLLRFDGATWSEALLPPGVTSVAALAASDSGTLWVRTSSNLLWERKVNGRWEARPASESLESIGEMSAEGEDDIWLSTDTSLLSSRALPPSNLCQTPCSDFWHESARLSQVPHGD